MLDMNQIYLMNGDFFAIQNRLERGSVCSCECLETGKEMGFSDDERRKFDQARAMWESLIVNVDNSVLIRNADVVDSRLMVEMLTLNMRKG
jgi:hypothetical protein